MIDQAKLKSHLAEVRQRLTSSNHLERFDNIDTAVSKYREQQEQEAHETVTELRELTNKINTLRAECSRSTLDWVEHDEHVARIHELEREQVEWSKRLEADEAKLRAVEAELRAAKQESAEWDTVQVEDEVEFSGDALALRFFRNLGFIPCYPADIKAKRLAVLAAQAKVKKSNSRPSAMTQPATTMPEFDRLLVRSESTGRTTMIDVSAQGQARKGWDDVDLASHIWAAAR